MWNIFNKYPQDVLRSWILIVLLSSFVKKRYEVLQFEPCILSNRLECIYSYVMVRIFIKTVRKLEHTNKSPDILFWSVKEISPAQHICILEMKMRIYAENKQPLLRNIPKFHLTFRWFARNSEANVRFYKTSTPENYVK